MNNANRLRFERKADMSADKTDLGHGDTVAAWTTVSAIMLASVFVTAGIWFASNLLIVVGVALTLGGLVAGVVLKKAGYGKGGSKAKSKH
jgi:hypothetical protein